MYGVYAKLLGVRIDPIVFRPGEPMSPQALVEGIDDRSRLVFLPNPSQPVENTFDVTQLRVIATHCRDRGILFVIDEAYHFFGGESALPLIDAFDNVLVMRTFSKAFGAASLRLGYVVGSKNALGPLAAFRLAHEANSISLHAGAVLLDNFETFVKSNIRNICQGRDYLRRACLEYGLEAWGKTANYVLIDLGDHARANAVFQALGEKGLHVKDGFPPPIDRHILVTCGPVDLMVIFFGAFREVLEEIGASRRKKRNG
jgi:histidinol-phosphate/aromatic aminotransferase/cobyric acid decarboxylase-like protein